VRILHAIQELEVGGAERVVAALVQGAEEAGHHVAVAAAPGPIQRELVPRAHPLPLVRRRPWLLPAAARRLREACRAERPELVHLHNPGIAAAGALAGLGRIASLVTVHGVPDEDYRTAARLLRLTRFPVVACGPGVATALEQCGLRVAQTIVNGVSPAPSPRAREEVARELRFDPTRPLLLSVGRLAPVKNQSLAIAALADIGGAVLVLVGDGPLRRELEAEARARGVSDHVVLAGMRPDARALIGAADAVVMTSTSEGLPLVALEALSAGVPLVATAVRGVRELLRDGEDALLVAPGDAAALAEAARRVLADEELRQRLRSGGLHTAGRHSEAAMVAAYLELYTRLRAGPSRRR
jgi:glycosyltransferase involved in cell wall biosynthesis